MAFHPNEYTFVSGAADNLKVIKKFIEGVEMPRRAIS
jgi:hypothetical protein